MTKPHHATVMDRWNQKTEYYVTLRGYTDGGDYSDGPTSDPIETGPDTGIK